MAARLKSTFGRVPWSLLLKTVVFGVSWLIFPFWVFLLVALYLYFIPFFKPKDFGWAFFLTLAAAFFAPAIFSITGAFPMEFVVALTLSLIFYLTLGAKDLVVLNRSNIYEIAVLLLLFILYLIFFAKGVTTTSLSATFISITNSLVFFFLVRALGRYSAFFPEKQDETASVTLLAFLVGQVSFILFLFPLTIFSQGAILFLVSAFFIGCLRDKAQGILDIGVVKRRVLAFAALVFVVFLTSPLTL